MIVLCLHHMGTEAGAGAKYRQFLLSPAGLRRAIRSVRLLGMEIIPLADVLRDPAAFWQGRHANKVVLTFDDGYVNNLTEALPVLAEEKCPATVFAVAGKLGGYNDWDPDLPRAPLMTLEQMRQMTRTPGLTIGSHGLLHRRLQTLPPDELAREITESHAILSAGLGAAYIPALAYPYGNYSAEVRDRVKDSPFQCAFTIRRGHWQPATHPYEIPRFCLGWQDGYPLVFLLKCLRNRFRSALQV